MIVDTDTFEARFVSGPWAGRRQVEYTPEGEYPERITVPDPVKPTAMDLLDPRPLFAGHTLRYVLAEDALKFNPAEPLYGWMYVRTG